jgi:predicted branched-subunit amino acid permease
MEKMAKQSSVTSISIGVGLATGLYGVSFGALSVAAGLDIWQTQVLSLLMFSGGSQFAFVGVIAAAGGAGVASAGVGAAIISAWLLGIRNGFYAVRLAPILKRVGLAKLIPAMLTIDESTAVATAQNNEADQVKGFWITGIAVFVFWNLMTLAGAILGDALGDPSRWGLDAAAAAAFLGLLWPRLAERQALVVGAAALLIATAATPFLSAGIPVLLAGISAVVVGFFNWFSPRKGLGK